MFEQQFGLKKRPFGSHAVGADVFVGPQTARLIGRAKKLFAEPDAVLCVTGPVGSGKSTLVARALSAVGLQHTVIQIGRIKLGPDEVLEFLLRELGLKQMPAGTIQKLTVFRKLLDKFAENDIRLFVVVEDAERLGKVALAELETLTSTDSGVSNGGNLVLMAEEPLTESLKEPALARLRQRARLHYAMAPMTCAEVRGYLTHGIRQAGGEIADVMEDDAVVALHALSEGIPRVLNNLVSSSLVALAETSEPRLGRERVVQIAADEYGIESEIPETMPQPTQPVATEDDTNDRKTPETEPDDVLVEAANAFEAAEQTASTLQGVAEAEAEPLQKPELAADLRPAEAERVADEPAAVQVEPVSDEPAAARIEPAGEAPAAAQVEPAADEPAATDVRVTEHSEETAGASTLLPEEPPKELAEPATVDSESGDFAIPELIQDTLPDLEILAPELANSALEQQAAAAVADEDAAAAVIDAQPAEADSLAADDGEIPVLTAAAPPAAVLPRDDESPPASVDAAIGTQEPNTAGDDIPTLFDSAISAAPSRDSDSGTAERAAEDDLPAWDRDPTLAELTPDLDALENAMATARGAAPKTPLPAKPADKDKEPDGIPTITLDDSIRRKIDISEQTEQAPAAPGLTEAESATSEASPMIDTVAEDLSGKPGRADAELERIANELSKAKTLEDVDDKLAETLFGEEFTMLAAEVVANAPPEEPANEASANQAPEPDAPVELSLAETSAGMTPPDVGANAADEPNLESEFKETWGDNSLEVSIETDTGGGMDLSASQRLATVRALNAGTTATVNGNGTAAKAPGNEPEPIEDQINTSITQTLKALSSSQIEDLDDDEEEQKSGFFSRFRKS
ncbi:MAG: AAA family ATPase [Pseudomonadota bacterium]